MRVSLEFDRAAVLRENDRVARLILRGATDAVRSETRGLEQDLEKITRLAVPGKLWRGWASESYPKRGIARIPEGSVSFKSKPGGRAEGAFTFWTQEGRISRGGGKYLAFPTPAAGPRGFGTGRSYVSNSPKEWQRRRGVKLDFRPPREPGGNAVLILRNARVSAKTGRATQGKKGRKGVEDGVVMFILVPFLDFRNAFAIEPVIARRRSTLPIAVDRSIGDALARG
jgi:hypothetical protein